MELINEVYKTEGRLNRLRYLKYQVIWYLISAVIGFILGFVSGFLTSDVESILVTMPTGIWSFIAGVGGIMLSIRRLHDLDKSGWWLILSLVPLVNIFFLLYLWLAPGTAGYNRYGQDPLTY